MNNVILEFLKVKLILQYICCCFKSYGFLNISLNFSKNPTNVMNLTKNDAAGYLNTLIRVIMCTSSFKNHIQGISCIYSYHNIFLIILLSYCHFKFSILPNTKHNTDLCMYICSLCIIYKV